LDAVGVRCLRFGSHPGSLERINVIPILAAARIPLVARERAAWGELMISPESAISHITPRKLRTV
jgi:hypothetical protein